jgi:antitoxin (DNA-binding transcriptional repressor) of toxin-antitoxin stability system
LTMELPEATFRRKRTVGLKVLKNQLSAYVRLAAGGETVLVTDRDKVVAELVPPQAGRRLLGDEFVAKGVREGWLQPARTVGAGPPPRGEPGMSDDELMREIEADRADR